MASWLAMRFKRSILQKRVVKKMMRAVNTKIIGVKFEPGLKYAYSRFIIPAIRPLAGTDVSFGEILNDFNA